MESNSRLKKYEELRQTLLEENKENVETPKLSRFAKRLSNIDADYFQPIVNDYENNVLTDITPTRSKSNDEEVVDKKNDAYFNEQEILARALRISSDKEENVSDDELLNQFLKEIRNYNKRQGVRSMDDTRLEILKQVKVNNPQTNNHDVEVVNDKPKTTETKPNTARFSIAKQVRDLLSNKDQNNNDDEEQNNDKINESLVLAKDHEASEKYLQYIDEDRQNKARLLEETQQLRLKLSEHEDELDEIGTGIDYTRKLLNVLLGLLLLTVLIAGGILAYLVVRGS